MSAADDHHRQVGAVVHRGDVQDPVPQIGAPLGAIGGGQPYAAASVKMTHMARDVLRRGIRGFSLFTSTQCRGAPG
jgi:hypothetical protein